MQNTPMFYSLSLEGLIIRFICSTGAVCAAKTTGLREEVRVYDRRRRFQTCHPGLI